MPAFFKVWLNFKITFGELYGIQNASMVQMMQELGIQMAGVQHGGIDACRNGARLIGRAIWDGKCIATGLREA